MANKEGISSDWDIDVYRNPWDSDEQWELRSRFMEKHKDSIPEEELVCLAQVHTNIEFLGCSYPDDVSKRVKELANGLMGEVGEQDKHRRPTKGVPFVKAAEDTNMEPMSGAKRSSKLELPPAKHRPTEFIRPTNRSNAASYFTEENPHPNPHYNSSTQSGNNYQMQNYYTSNYKSSQEKLGSGVPLRREPEIVDMEPDRAWSGPSNARNAANNADVSGKIASLQFKFDRLVETLNSLSYIPPKKVMHSLKGYVCQAKLELRWDLNYIKLAKRRNSSRINRSEHLKFNCEVFISDVFIASGRGVKKGDARSAALTNAVVLLSNPSVRISAENGRLVAVKESKPVINDRKLLEVEQSGQFEVNNDKKEHSRERNPDRKLLEVEKELDRELPEPERVDMEPDRARWSGPPNSRNTANNAGSGPSNSRNAANKKIFPSKIETLQRKFEHLVEMLNIELRFRSQDKLMKGINNYVDEAELKLRSFIEARGNFKFKCDVYISDVFIESGEGVDKETARVTAFRNAMKLLLNPCLKISEESGRLAAVIGSRPIVVDDHTMLDEVEPDQQLEVEVDNEDKVVPNTKYSLRARPRELLETIRKAVTAVNPGAPEPNNVPTKYTSIHDFGEFIIIHYLENVRLTAPGILQNSADYNRKKLVFSFTECEDSEAKCRCEVELDTFKLSEGRASTKVQAKLVAAEEALKKLRTVAYTIAVKRSVWSEGDVSKNELKLPTDGDCNEDTPIPESNVGNKLLRQMGWTGGGLGKPGNTGIEEPIQAVQIVGRQGLGLQRKGGLTQEFTSKLSRIVRDYAKSKSEFDLVFTKEFSKEERAFVHKVAYRLHLKNTSRGTGSDRYLVISKRVQPKKLLNKLLMGDGSHEKYDVIPPTGT